VAHALLEPNGLLASGGELSPEWLLSAYQQGIFPWYNPGEPILWWSPDPRYGFSTSDIHLSRSRIRQLRAQNWSVRADTCFEQVIQHCAHVPRNGQHGTWITDEMISAYTTLHQLGYAHSIEIFDGEQLVGGLYGLAIGQLFCAESMFSLKSQASALALYALGRQLSAWHWPWIDAQMENPHLKLLGGQEMRRADYMQLIASQTQKPAQLGSWHAHFSALKLADYQDMKGN
jgi:leucyl/phenylalanyl-tRNA---protein transferase